MGLVILHNWVHVRWRPQLLTYLCNTNVCVNDFGVKVCGTESHSASDMQRYHQVTVKSIRVYVRDLLYCVYIFKRCFHWQFCLYFERIFAKCWKMGGGFLQLSNCGQCILRFACTRSNWRVAKWARKLTTLEIVPMLPAWNCLPTAEAIRVIVFTGPAFHDPYVFSPLRPYYCTCREPSAAWSLYHHVTLHCARPDKTTLRDVADLHHSHWGTIIIHFASTNGQPHLKIALCALLCRFFFANASWLGSGFRYLTMATIRLSS